MWMDYITHAWLDSIPHVMKGTTASDYQGCVAMQGHGITRCSICQCLNHWKKLIIWSFNCLIALEAKFHLCKGSDFIVHFMTCMLKHIKASMQAFTRITGSICRCLVIGSFKSQFIYLLDIPRKKERKVSGNSASLQICISRTCVAIHVIVKCFTYVV